MQSKKRFREIFLWNAEWFMSLDNNEKLFWYYINDHCDNIGVWEPNFKLAGFHIPDLDIDQFFQRVNRDKIRIIEARDGSWFLTRFVKFQYCKSKPLNPKSPAHKSYLELMVERGLLKWFTKNYPDVIPDDLSLIEVSESSNNTLLEVSEGHKDKEEDQGRVEVEDSTDNYLPIKEGDDFSDVPLVGASGGQNV